MDNTPTTEDSTTAFNDAIAAAMQSAQAIASHASDFERKLMGAHCGAEARESYVRYLENALEESRHSNERKKKRLRNQAQHIALADAAIGELIGTNLESHVRASEAEQSEEDQDEELCDWAIAYEVLQDENEELKEMCAAAEKRCEDLNQAMNDYCDEVVALESREITETEELRKRCAVAEKRFEDLNKAVDDYCKEVVERDYRPDAHERGQTDGGWDGVIVVVHNEKTKPQLQGDEFQMV